MKSLLLLFLSVTISQAGWQQEILPFGPPSAEEFKPEKLEYELSWQGAVKSGTLVIEFGKSDKRYPKSFITHTYGRSTGAAYALFPYDFTFTSFATLKSHKPIVFVAKEVDAKETVKTKNSYRKPGITHRSTTTLKRSTKVIEKEHTFAAKAVHDPMTTMLEIRKQPLKNGDVVKICGHPFASPYLLTITVLNREKHLDYDCIKLDVKIRKIDKKSGKLKQYKKLKKATLWITDDSQRAPVELRSKVFIGDVRATLIKRTPL